jgi:hypothetical protein
MKKLFKRFKSRWVIGGCCLVLSLSLVLFWGLSQPAKFFNKTEMDTPLPPEEECDCRIKIEKDRPKKPAPVPARRRAGTFYAYVDRQQSSAFV